ncbi:MAG: hypothetical protein M1812_000382 [Candelaria pacifica]|nr:MAG: hypothetical protein M1812_000382 [Candelaria pacifica]
MPSKATHLPLGEASVLSHNGSFSPPAQSTHGDTRANIHGASSLRSNSKGRPRNIGRSTLRETSSDELHDVICVGFGPASLAIAIALHDTLATPDALCRPPGLRGRPPKVAFLERQCHFAWHAGMLLPGAKMQISFVKDLATLRDPRSEFTFLNYLHKQNRLVQFTNLGTFLPLRIEYEDYMRWCASWFDDVVRYGQEVMAILPEKSSIRSGKVDSFVVKSKDIATGLIKTRRARHVVIAVGGKPSIPQSLPQEHPRVIHSSAYSSAVPELLRDMSERYRVAVIGSGQSAAEIFNDLHSRYPNAETFLIIKGAALKPSDDSPFVNEIFDPCRVDDIFNQDADARKAAIKCDRSTNYGVVRLELLEHIYGDMYAQRLQDAHEDNWQHRILNYSTVTRIEDLQSSSHATKASGLRLHVQKSNGHNADNGSDTLEVDAVLVATGYSRNAHEYILEQTRHLLPINKSNFPVARDYRINFDENKVDANAGIWLQGCNEGTHGLSDTLLSILASRGGEIVESIFGEAGAGGMEKDAHKVNGVNGHEPHHNCVNGHT